MMNSQIENAVSFLLSQQDSDGYWRDYNLEPGRSEAWTTACAGLAIIKAYGKCSETDRAVKALLSAIRKNGWGYNSHTACDADTTSWVIRFLSSADAMGKIDSESLLGDYISYQGRVRTFSSQIPFGSWAEEHDEVAPVTGIALHSAGRASRFAPIRECILKSNGWQPFWWKCYSYVCAQSLEFLFLSGGIPDKIKKRETEILKNLPAEPSSVFDLAQRLSCSYYLGGGLQYDTLLRMQKPDGSWDSSGELFVPSQITGLKSEPKEDDRRLMSTAMSILTLIKYSG